MRKKRVGDILTERGTISQEVIERAVASQGGQAVRLGELLVKQGLVSKGNMGAAVAEVSRVAYTEIPKTIPPEVLNSIDRDVAVLCCALPISRTGLTLVVAMAEPQNLELRDRLRFYTGCDISPRFSFQEDILDTIDRLYVDKKAKAPAPPREDKGATDADAGEMTWPAEAGDMEFLTASQSESQREAMRELQAGMQQRTPAVRLVTGFLAAAAEKKASDVHIQPDATGAVVRIRVDGILRELTRIPEKYRASVISRVKILADMDIAERRMPQDGRFLMKYGGEQIDLRVSTLPTHFGEKVVMRLLDPSATRVTFGQLGFAPTDAARLTELLKLPQGMILVTGPTGSGKSTTLYAALNLLSEPGRNVVTVEDPVEFMLDGISQVQVHAKTGLTFASCLRSILRQDPDVVMVGEIRDAETAEVSMKATQTGHLVLSTLHTNDSISSVSRLLDLGVAPYLVASSVTAVMAQRLVRKLCDCRQRASAINFKELDRFMGESVAPEGLAFFRPGSCAKCDGTGYRGRVGIYEILLIDEGLREVIQTGARPEELRRLARASGFRTMQQNALAKMQEGLTTFDEVLRVVPSQPTAPARCGQCGREFVPSFSHCPYCGTAKASAPAR